MGLIKAAKNAISGELKDQFLAPISCEDMGNEILMKKVTREDGVIPNGSRIIVAPGQVAALYDNGKILDATAEAGVYEFKTESSPSFFGGDFGTVFKDMWERFKFGGGIAKEQAVYFFNVKEIMDNKFGTQNPIPYKDWGHPLTNPRTNSLMAMSVEIKCFGKYSFKIVNPALFMMEVAGNTDVYTKTQIVEQMRAEVIASFQNVLSSLGEDNLKIAALSLPNQTDEIRELMDEQVFDEPIRNRGLKIVTFVVESVTLTNESKEKINQYELGSDTYQQKATLTEAYANAVQDAANNSASSLNGFMGIGIANMGMGNPFSVIGNSGTATPDPNLHIDPRTADPVKRQEEPVKDKIDTVTTLEENEKLSTAQEVQNDDGKWECECGQENRGNFCMKCGKPKKKKLVCPNCKMEITPEAKFCGNCGTKLK